MFCVVYKFKIKNGMNKQFEKYWAGFTEAIYRVRGSLGSRLHHTEDSQIYIAYAQWPSKETFDAELGDEHYTNQDLQYRKEMIETIEGEIERTHLVISDDRLKDKIYE